MTPQEIAQLRRQALEFALQHAQGRNYHLNDVIALAERVFKYLTQGA
jgi:hypothetical protein